MFRMSPHVSSVPRALLALAAALFLATSVRAQAVNYDSPDPSLAALTTDNFVALTIPGVGDSYILQVQGLPAATIVIHDMSLAMGNFPLVPFGALLIHPALLFFIQVAASTPVNGGAATFTINIPNDPALVGVTVFSQAGVFAFASFTLTWGLQTTVMP